MTGTMYEAILNEVWNAHATHLRGHRDGVFGVVSARPLASEAESALISSARKLGFGDHACFFCTLRSDAEQNSSDSSEDARAHEARTLDARSLDARAVGARDLDARTSEAQTVDARDLDARTSDARPSDSCVLNARALFEIIEGIDPIVLVAADSQAARALSDAYHVEVTPLVRSRVFGRTTVAFRSFESMLESPSEKQQAWALLKQLS